MSALQFPSDQDFDIVAATAATIKWGDLPTGTVYAIKAIKVTKDKYGVSFVGDLETQDGDQSKVWLPQRLGDDLKGCELPVFVMSKGFKLSMLVKHEGSYKYYAYMAPLKRKASK